MEVKLYLADSDELKNCQQACLSKLTAKRRKEAEAFLEEKDRLLHCAAGLLLRTVLHVTQDSDLRYGEYDKPELTNGSTRFSLSHSGHYAVLAVCDRQVGVDIEPVLKPQILPRKVLTGEEMDWLEEHPEAEDFCLLWTRLESALKAEGCGLALEKRAFSLLEEGNPWYWETMTHDGHTITCAGEEPLVVQVHCLSAEELLKETSI